MFVSFHILSNYFLNGKKRIHDKNKYADKSSHQNSKLTKTNHSKMLESPTKTNSKKKQITN